MVASKSDECKHNIQIFETVERLNIEWRKHICGEKLVHNWGKGKLLEYLFLRAFEINGADVRYPYSIFGDAGELEQIDGVIHLDSQTYIIECKEQKKKINYSVLSKLSGRLKERHSSSIGILLSMTDLTAAAYSQMKSLSPQLILFWGKKDFEYCLENNCFAKCLKRKLQIVQEECEYNYQFHYEDSKRPEHFEPPLF